MALQIGVPQSAKKDAGAYGGLPRVRARDINTGDSWTTRIVQGVVKSQLVFYPTIKQDRKTGAHKIGKQVIVRPPSGSPFDALVDAERRVYAKLDAAGKRDYANKSPELGYSNQWHYLAFDLKQGGHTSPKLVEHVANYSIFQALTELEEKKDPNKPDYLLNGLLFMYDIIISVSQNPNKPGNLGRTYSAQVYGNNPHASSVPKEHIDVVRNPLPIDVIQSCFTEQEWAAIEASDLDLASMNQADSPEKIMETLRSFPLFLYGPESFNPHRPAFPDVDTMIGVCEEIGIPFLDAQVAEEFLSGPKQLPATSGVVTSAPAGTAKKSSVEPEPDSAEEPTEFQEAEVVSESPKADNKEDAEPAKSAADKIGATKKKKKPIW